jgi:hypothetical protein
MKWPALSTYTKVNRLDPWFYYSILFLLGIIIYFIKREGFTSTQEKNNFINTYPPVKKGIYNLTDSELPL